MLFWTKKCRIKNKQVFSELIPVLIHKVRSKIKHTQHTDQCIGNRKTSISYGRSEAEDELKTVDIKCTKPTSQLKTDQIQV